MKKVQQLCVVLVLFLGITITARSQQSASPPAHAVINAIIHFNSGKTLEGGAIVWRDGIIKAVGKKINIPFDAFVIDAGDSLHVYPGFIDGLALWGSPGRPDVEAPDRPGNPGYERAGIQPQRQPNQVLEKSEIFEKAQKQGFTTAAIGLEGEMLPGQVDVFSISGKDKQQLLKKGIAVLAQFKAARGSAYPSTIMGLMAKYRQLFYNAKGLQTHIQYYQEVAKGYPAPERSAVLEALFPVRNNKIPFYFVADSKEDIQRIYWLQDELGFDFVLVSGKNAYEQAKSLKSKNIAVLASIELPEEPEWRDKQKEKGLSKEERHFRQRQGEAYDADIRNVKKLVEAGVKAGYASNGMKLKEFPEYIRTLHEDAGLSEQDILQLLTNDTAEILGVGNRIGRLKKGYIASFSVFTEPFLEKKAQVLYSISNGSITEFNVEPKSKDSEDKEEYL